MSKTNQKDSVNKIKKVTAYALEQGHKLVVLHFEEWKKTISAELPEGDKYHLARIQDLVDELDRPLELKYTPKGQSVEVPMLFLPPRLKDLSRRALMNRLNVH